MGTLSAVLRLTRVEHSLMLVIAVIAAELVVGSIPPWPVFILALVPPVLISMASFAINDYYDVETDRMNRKKRPLVEGTLTPKGARNIAATCFVAGVAASALINAYAFVIALIFASLAFLYSYKLKTMLLVGNAYIALTMVIPFVYGDLVVARYIAPNIVLIAFVIFLSGLAREIHGMVRDRRGDMAARRSKSLVRYIGARRSSLLALLLYVEAVAISIVMFFMFMPFAGNAAYIAPIAVVDALLLYVAVGYMYKDGVRFHSLARNLSLGAMGLALATYIISAVVYLPL
jgi:4-hydroxybenzoate polyprenyltransferase